MSKRFNNKRLIFLLLGLAVILIMTLLVKIPKENATFRSHIVDFDTSSVNKIILNNRISDGNTVEFNRNNNKWIVQQGNIKSAPEAGAVQNIFNEVLNIKPQSLAAIDQSRWKEFNLTDSLATRIRLLNSKGQILADIMIGKLEFKQPDKPNRGNIGENIVMTSYVRLYNQKEVYAIDGLIPFSFNIKFEDWRDKSFIKSNKKDITKIQFIYPADTSYFLIKQDSGWFSGNLQTDSMNMSNYLNSLSLMHGQTFKDGFDPDLNPVIQIIVTGNNSLKFSVQCYAGSNNDEYILNSTLRPDVYFTSKKSGIYSQLFKPQRYFIRKQKANK